MEQETPATEEHYRNSLDEARATIARLNAENMAIHYALELALHRAKAAEDTIQHDARVETRCNQTKSRKAIMISVNLMERFYFCSGTHCNSCSELAIYSVSIHNLSFRLCESCAKKLCAELSIFVTRRNASITNVIDFDNVMHDLDSMRDNLTDDEIGDLYEAE